MATGFTPKHEEDYPLNELTHEQFLVIGIEAAKKVGWLVNYVGKSGFVAYTDNGTFLWNAEVRIVFKDGIAKLNSTSTGSEFIDWGKNKKNIAAFRVAVDGLKSSFTPEDLHIKYEKLQETMVPAAEDVLTLPPPTTGQQITGFFSVFKPVKDFFITPILLDLNILIFILMVISGVHIMEPDSESLLLWGANFRPVTLEGEWWRLFTNCFLHIGIIHLLMNMYALVFIGVLLEPYLGKARFLSAYLLTGLIASMASLWWHDLTISAGASGAIFGMYGVFLAMLTTNLIEKTARQSQLASIGIFVVYNLINGLQGNIDNAAHIGGLIGGLVIGYAFIPSLRPETGNLKSGTIIASTLIILAICYAIYTKLPNDIKTYEKRMEEFVAMEAMALEIYSLPKTSPKDELLFGLKERGIYYWNKNIEIIDGFEKINLPLSIRTRNKMLREYCELRVKSYEVIYKAVLEDTGKYQAEIDDYNKQIEDKIKEISSFNATE